MTEVSFVILSQVHLVQGDQEKPLLLSEMARHTAKDLLRAQAQGESLRSDLCQKMPVEDHSATPVKFQVNVKMAQVHPELLGLLLQPPAEDEEEARHARP